MNAETFHRSWDYSLGVGAGVALPAQEGSLTPAGENTSLEFKTCLWEFSYFRLPGRFLYNNSVPVKKKKKRRNRNNLHGFSLQKEDEGQT